MDHYIPFVLAPPIPRSALEKDPRPRPLFDGNPVGEGTTRRGTATSGHRVLIKSKTEKSGSFGTWHQHEATSRISSGDRPHPEVRREGREPLPEHARESPLLSQSGGEKGLRGSGVGTLGVALEGTRRVRELLG